MNIRVLMATLAYRAALESSILQDRRMFAKRKGTWPSGRDAPGEFILQLSAQERAALQTMISEDINGSVFIDRELLPTCMHPSEPRTPRAFWRELARQRGRPPTPHRRTFVKLSLKRGGA